MNRLVPWIAMAVIVLVAIGPVAPAAPAGSGVRRAPTPPPTPKSYSANGGEAIPDPNATPPPVVDFVTFNGAIYRANDAWSYHQPEVPYRAVREDELGPIVGRVRWPAQLSYPYRACLDPSPGRPATASVVAVGEPLYAVRGYATTFRLAARQPDGRLVLYDVECSYVAKVGADLYDIRGQVARLRVRAYATDTPGWAVIDDEATITELVEMLLAGSVLSVEDEKAYYISYLLEVALVDGTTLLLYVKPGELGLTSGAVAVPTTFNATLDRVWREHEATSTPIAH